MKTFFCSQIPLSKNIIIILWETSDYVCVCAEWSNYKVCTFPTKLNFVKLCSLYKRLKDFCECKMLDFFFPSTALQFRVNETAV